MKEIGERAEGWRREWMDSVRVPEGSPLMVNFRKLWPGTKKGAKGWWEDWESWDLETETQQDSYEHFSRWRNSLDPRTSLASISFPLVDIHLETCTLPPSRWIVRAGRRWSFLHPAITPESSIATFRVPAPGWREHQGIRLWSWEIGEAT